MIRSIAVKLMYHKNDNIIEVIDNYNDFTIAEISVHKLPESCQGKALKDNGFKTKYGIQILAIKRKSTVIKEVSKDDYILEGDKLVVSGKLAKMKELFLQD